MGATKKTVLITGSSRGIGKAIHDVLSDTGQYTISAPTRQEMRLNEPESIERYLQKVTGVDILINNAGINILKAVDKIDDNSLHQMLSVNLEAPLRLIRRIVPYMKSHMFGRIVNISSIWGIQSKELRTLYSMTKFGLNGITKALGRELGAYNILVNSVCPGYVNTELTQKNIPFHEQEIIKKTIPLGRFAEPKEIATFIKFLISDENSYITGQTLVIDGGFLV
jgi:NAD(P)-dependent dehydrogenase (short-subunit alcohol dehydrogenase family)